MNKLQGSQILVKDVKFVVIKLQKTDAEVIKLIDETKQKQTEILKLKEVDRDMLRTVIQL